MQYDGSIVVATGRSRFDTAWKNHKITWSKLVDKLKDTYRTRETVAAYRGMSKDKQDKIKDIGGFVGGYIEGGHRTNGSIKYRSLICLDVDYADKWFWLDVSLLYGCAMLMYTTHKHAPEAPRYRLVLPLDRPVSAEEYEAIARRIAFNVGMQLFDPTTFQPTRLMYWPNSSIDGEYIVQHQDSPWLQADEILNEYADWKDSSTWPAHDSEDKIREKSAEKQGNPLDKSGLVGAFCNVYDIETAIADFLPGVYVKCDHMNNRYTFTGGSTSAGLTIYDGVFAYSHHSTDPVSHKLCNAFDLVRLHLFAGQDQDSAPRLPTDKLPSQGAMLDLAKNDTRVKRWLGEEKQRLAEKAFGVLEPEPEPVPGTFHVEHAEKEQDNDAWLELLQTDRKGKYLSTIDNIILILRHDPRLTGRLAYDEFNRQEIIKKSLPWRKIRGRSWWTDRDDAGLRHYLEKVYDIANVQKVRDAFDMLMIEKTFHPVRDYLGGLKWDGQGRLDELLIDYMGAEDTPYTRAVTRKTLTAAVARIHEPGVKFDYVLTLVGDQGQGKSTLFSELAGVWFSDSFASVGGDGNKAYEQLQGTWIMEIAELAGVRKADVEAIKHYISKQVDSYRPAYGRRLEHHPRQCIFVGTTNETLGFLRDDTGDRRFWPVPTMHSEPAYSVFKDLSGAEIDQVWAEALYRYQQGEKLFLEELESEAKKMQEAYKVKDERVDIIAAYLDTPLPAAWPEMNILERQLYIKDGEEHKQGTVIRTKVCVPEIWCELFGGGYKDMTANNTKHIHNMLRRIKDWKSSDKAVRFTIYGKQRTYIRNG